jgi:hypothetical protein
MRSLVSPAWPPARALKRVATNSPPGRTAVGGHCPLAIRQELRTARKGFHRLNSGLGSGHLEAAKCRHAAEGDTASTQWPTGRVDLVYLAYKLIIEYEAAALWVVTAHSRRGSRWLRRIHTDFTRTTPGHWPGRAKGVSTNEPATLRMTRIVPASAAPR